MNYEFKILNKKDITNLKNLINSLFIRQKNNFFLWESFSYYLNDIIIGVFNKKKLIGSLGL